MTDRVEVLTGIRAIARFLSVSNRSVTVMEKRGAPVSRDKSGTLRAEKGELWRWFMASTRVPALSAPSVAEDDHARNSLRNPVDHEKNDNGRNGSVQGLAGFAADQGAAVDGSYHSQQHSDGCYDQGSRSRA